MELYQGMRQPIQRNWTIALSVKSVLKTNVPSYSHRSFGRALRLNSFVVVSLISHYAAGATPTYRVTDLGNLGVSGGYTTGLGVNESGQVVGESSLDLATRHAFLYDAGIMYDLGSLGGNSSIAYGINSRGQVAGSSFLTDNATEHAFLWTPTTSNGHTGTMNDLGTLGGSTSRAYGLNDAGHVVGESFTSNGEVHGFLYDGTMHDLDTLGGYAAAFAINASDQIVGTSIAFTGGWVATLYDGTLNALLIGEDSGASSINDLGQITGSRTTMNWPDETLIARSFVYDNGTFDYDIGSLGGEFTAARDINNHGDIVGTALTTEGARHPFIYKVGRGVLDLNDLIDPQELSVGPDGVDDELIWSNAINDRGQIVAGGWNWYLLTPIPEVVPGDFNHDGTVDAADYVTWRKAGGSLNDYNIWRANFGQALFIRSGAMLPSAEPLSAPVPEPSILGLLIVVAMCSLSRQNRSKA